MSRFIFRDCWVLITAAGQMRCGRSSSHVSSQCGKPQLARFCGGNGTSITEYHHLSTTLTLPNTTILQAHICCGYSAKTQRRGGFFQERQTARYRTKMSLKDALCQHSPAFSTNLQTSGVPIPRPRQQFLKRAPRMSLASSSGACRDWCEIRYL
jgi:hypothetical protein